MKVLIATVCDSKYKQYIPLFIESALKAFPEYDIRVFYRGKMNREYVGSEFYTDYPYEVATTPTIRFCMDYVYVQGYDYVYMTDVDMLFLPEKTPLHEQHLKIMQKTGLCYENFAVPSQKYQWRMPGVHFSSKEWWEKTEEVRYEYLKRLKKSQIVDDSAYDEAVLYDICTKSGLGFVTKGFENWRWHGIHLGRYMDRKGRRKKIKQINDTMEVNSIIRVLQDKDLTDILTSDFPDILSIFYEVASRK